VSGVYIQLVAVEEAFKTSSRTWRSAQCSIRTRGASRRISSSPSCLLPASDPAASSACPRTGLTARSVLEKFAAMQMIDVHLPTTDGRELHLNRTTQPEPDLQLLIQQLKLELLPQPPPRITAAALTRAT